MSVKRNAVLIALSILIAFVLQAPAYSDVPLLINYQGKLTDSSGKPLNGSYTASFYLYQGANDGESVWQDESRTIEVENGVFSVQLGAESPLNVDVSDYPALYLQVEIYNTDSAEWEVFSPRQPLTTVVYAFNSEQLSGNSLADLDTRYVNEGQENIVTSAMIADNTISIDDIVENSFFRLDIDQVVNTRPSFNGGSGYFSPFTVDSNFMIANLNANYLQGFAAVDFASQIHSHSINHLDAADGSPQSALIVGNNGYVAIGGTDAPAYKLEVRGYDPPGSWTDGFIALKNENQDAGIRFFDGIGDGSVRHSIFNNYENGENILRITPHGNYLSGINIQQNGDVTIIGTTDNDGINSTLRIVSQANNHTLLIDGNEIDAIGAGRDLFLNNNSKNPVRVPVLVIQGGADLSEGFDIKPYDEDILPKPGMLVSIDSQNPGSLQISHRSYDNKVAGIISGAGGVKTGLSMGQSESIADGNYPVALTGRVYCNADASFGAIDPGDLLTTSITPGHAMKVQDHSKAQGAIIGKAMTPLAEGKGLVLVLVSLQ